MFSSVVAKRQLLLVVACFAALLAHSVAFARKAEYYYNSVTGEVRDDMCIFPRFDRHFFPQIGVTIARCSRLIFTLCVRVLRRFLSLSLSLT